MKRYSLVIFALAAVLAAAPSASAQMQVIPPGGSQFNPPPAPPAPPSMAVPVVPQMDAPAALAGVQPSQRGSFSDRIMTCLDEGAAAGLGPNERAAYSRSCANR